MSEMKEKSPNNFGTANRAFDQGRNPTILKFPKSKPKKDKNKEE